jgi:methylase of polypeptide subunit release factors
VKPPVLIPRFETEYLVGEAVDEIRKRWKKGSTLEFVDLGCGTGAIGLSLIK